MADEELELDVNEKKGGNKTMIMIIVGILLLNGIGIGAWMFLSSGDSSDANSAHDSKQEVDLGPLKYLTLVPEFVVNFGPQSRVRYLQVDLQISTRQEDSLSVVSTYRPVLRNDILVLLSDVDYEDLKDRKGKEKLQKRLLNAINKVIVGAQQASADHSEESAKDDEHESDDEVVDGPIENVYFTSFIMQ